MEGRDWGQQNRESGMWRGVPRKNVNEEAQPSECPSAARQARTVSLGLKGEDLEASNSWGKCGPPRQSVQKV